MRSLLPCLIACLLLPSLASAKVVGETVKHYDAKTELHSYIAYDDAIEGKRPGILVVHEWWGLNDYAKRRADELAAQGYVALAIDMYGMGRTTTDPKEAGKWAGEVMNTVAMEERSTLGLKKLLAHELVDSDRVAAIGFCFGGTTVTRLAYYGAPVNGVVSFHGSLPAAPEGAGESTKAKLLILHGAVDPFAPEEKAAAFRDAAEREGLDYQMIYYAGADHAFTNPAADDDAFDATNYDPVVEKRSLAHMHLFFDQIFTTDQAE